MTQTDRLYAYLKKHGPIDGLTAWRQLGIYRLGARIFDLKESGVKINRKMKRVLNRDGEETRVAEYRLA